MLCPPSVFEGSLPPALHTTGVHRGITRYASSEARPPARRRWRARAKCAGVVSVVATPVSMRERGARPAAAGPVRSLRTCRAARSAGQPSCQQRPRRPVARVPGSPAGAGVSRHPRGLSFFIQLDFQFVSEANVKGGLCTGLKKRNRALELTRAPGRGSGCPDGANHGPGPQRWATAPRQTARPQCPRSQVAARKVVTPMRWLNWTPKYFVSFPDPPPSPFAMVPDGPTKCHLGERTDDSTALSMCRT